MSERPPITPDLKVAKFLEAYPELEATLIAQAAVFQKLRNPILRRTMARVTSLAQAAAVAGLPPGALVQALRRAAGIQDEPAPDTPDPATAVETAVAAVADTGPVVAEFDADALLAAGQLPLTEIRAALSQAQPGQVVRVRATFRPVPLLEALRRSPCDQVVRPQPDGHWLVDFRRLPGGNDPQRETTEPS